MFKVCSLIFLIFKDIIIKKDDTLKTFVLFFYVQPDFCVIFMVNFMSKCIELCKPWLNRTISSILCED